MASYLSENKVGQKAKLVVRDAKESFRGALERGCRAVARVFVKHTCCAMFLEIILLMCVNLLSFISPVRAVRGSDLFKEAIKAFFFKEEFACDT